MASRTALTDAVARHMPSGPYRDFLSWALSARNPRQQEFLRTIGVTQLINMNMTLLAGLVEESRWPVMLRYAGIMNAYQVLEVISDNLAIGLGKPHLDETDLERRALVSSINRAMIETLTPGRHTPAVLLLSGHARQAARHASSFEQSLAAQAHADLVDEYVRFHAGRGEPEAVREELEYGLWPALVANVETCRELVAAMEGSATAGLLRQGLMDRYRAVDRTLFAEHLSRLELACTGAHTILVAPTLAFIVGALVEQVHEVDRYPRMVFNGVISDVLADAALLVRLQNDIGTRLLRMTPAQQAAQVHRVRHEDAGAGVELLLGHGDDPTFARLHKDLEVGESNVALWHARRADSATAAWLALGESLAYYAQLYAQHSARLASGLAELDDRLEDRRASTVIERFVRFHERMYAHQHTELVGEYAI